MELAFSLVRNTLVVIPGNDLVTFKVKNFTRTVVDKAHELEFKNMLIDLSSAKVIDSHGFGSLIYLTNFMNQHGGIMALCEIDPIKLSTLRLLHLEDQLKIYPTKFEALRDLEDIDEENTGE